jgi:hypothetical protein
VCVCIYEEHKSRRNKAVNGDEETKQNKTEMCSVGRGFPLAGQLVGS